MVGPFGRRADAPAVLCRVHRDAGLKLGRRFGKSDEENVHANEQHDETHDSDLRHSNKASVSAVMFVVVHGFVAA